MSIETPNKDLLLEINDTADEILKEGFIRPFGESQDQTFEK